MRVEDIPEPVCGEGQIKIKPAFVGICGTGMLSYELGREEAESNGFSADLHEYLGGPTFAPVTPHPVTKETIPITFGHEFSGTGTSSIPTSHSPHPC